MIFQYQVNKQGYILGYYLVSEKGFPAQKYEVTRPKRLELRDENGKPQWTIRDNPEYDSKTDHIDDRYIIEHDPIQPTIEELEAKKQVAIKARLRIDLPDIILQNKDNPEVLAQALCDRAKEIEVENDLRTT